MNRIDFAKGIKYKKYIDDIHRTFDETMAMYEIIGEHNIHPTPIYNDDDLNIIKYKIDTIGIDNVNFFIGYISAIHITIYGNTYTTIVERGNNYIIVELIKT